MWTLIISFLVSFMWCTNSPIKRIIDTSQSLLKEGTFLTNEISHFTRRIILSRNSNRPQRARILKVYLYVTQDEEFIGTVIEGFRLLSLSLFKILQLINTEYVTRHTIHVKISILQFIFKFIHDHSRYRRSITNVQTFRIMIFFFFQVLKLLENYRILRF